MVGEVPVRKGDQVRIIPELEGSEDHKILWDDPPDFTSIYRKNHVGRFRYTEVGMVLEQRFLNDVHDSLPTSFWVKVLCPGGIGWIKRCDLELV
jgi:hypothetical protein